MKDQKKKTSSGESSTRPEKTFRDGDVHCSLFRREHNGNDFWSASFTRGYKDSSNKLQFSKSFNPEDLPGLINVAQQASSFLADEKLNA